MKKSYKIKTNKRSRSSEPENNKIKLNEDKSFLKVNERSFFNEPEFNLLITDLFRKTNFCFQHNENYQLYCINEKKMCCVQCVHNNEDLHKNHKIVFIKKVFPALKEEIENFQKGEIQQILSEIKGFLKINGQNENFLQKKFNHLREKVKCTFAELKEMIYHQEINLNLEIEKILLEKKKENDKNFQENSFFIKKIEEFINHNLNFPMGFENFPEYFNKISIFKTFYYYLQKVCKNYNQNSTFFDINFDFSDEILKILNEIHNSALSYSKKDISTLIDLRLYLTNLSFNNEKLKNVGNFRTVGKKVELKNFIKLKEKSNFFTNTFNIYNYDNFNEKKPKMHNFFYSDKELFFNSRILSKDILSNEKTSEVFPKCIKETDLLYSLNEHGKSSEIFHKKCDNLGPYLILIQANYNYIFGYFLPVPFRKINKFIVCEDCFIFKLTDKNGINPCKFVLKNDKKHISFYQSTKSPSLGTFIDGKQDLFIEF